MTTIVKKKEVKNKIEVQQTTLDSFFSKENETSDSFDAVYKSYEYFIPPGVKWGDIEED